jgi:tetratricopeptide (TPR) repeat protein
MKLWKITVVALIGMMLLSLQCFAKNSEEGYQSFAVSFEQDGKVINPNGHVINLEKRGFAITVDFLGYQGETAAIRLSTSITDTYYKVASSGLQVSELLADGISMPEATGAQKNLILTETKAIQYLFIDADGSRFHEVKTRDNVISGKRYITELNFRGAKSFPIQDLPVNELYMVCIKRSSTGVQQEYYLIQFPKPEFPKQPLTAEQWILQGIKYEQLKDFNMAIEAYTRALAVNSQYDFQAYLKRGIAGAMIGRFNQALTDSNAALAIRPDNIDAYFLRAYVLTAVGSKAQSIEDYSKIITLNPNLSRAYWQRAMLLYNEKGRFRLKHEDLQAALDDFSKVIEFEPNNAAAYKNRADIYHVLKEYDKALDDYNKAISLVPNNVSYYENRGLTYSAIAASTGKDTSEESWENDNEIIKIDPWNADAYYGRAVMGNKLSKDFYLVKADLETAIKLYFEKANSKYSKSDIPLMATINNVLMFKGELLRAHGYFDEALDAYRSILKYKPDFIRYLYHYTGVIYFEKGEYDKAIEDCTKAIELTNWSWDYIVRGKAYKAKGMLEEAKSDFSKAVSLQPNLEEARTELNSLQ